jgi:hypothetical protein
MTVWLLGRRLQMSSIRETSRNGLSMPMSVWTLPLKSCAKMERSASTIVGRNVVGMTTRNRNRPTHHRARDSEV